MELQLFSMFLLISFGHFAQAGHASSFLKEKERNIEKGFGPNHFWSRTPGSKHTRKKRSSDKEPSDSPVFGCECGHYKNDYSVMKDTPAWHKLLSILRRRRSA